VIERDELFVLGDFVGLLHRPELRE
jgi:hypothetical protein